MPEVIKNPLTKFKNLLIILANIELLVYSLYQTAYVFKLFFIVSRLANTIIT